MSVISRLFMPPRPTVALEIAARHVSALRLGSGTPPSIDAHAVEPLPEGAVAPALASSNILDPAAVAAALGRALARVGGARHVALVVPDAVAKVTLVRFDQVPAKAADLDAMLRWNIRKSLPFKSRRRAGDLRRGRAGRGRRTGVRGRRRQTRSDRRVRGRLQRGAAHTRAWSIWRRST